MSQIILALDGMGMHTALDLVSKVGGMLYAVKIHDLWDRYSGMGVINQLKDNGAPRVWVDAKLHDIPTTVRNRTLALGDNGADIVSVHAYGGKKMMAAAVDSGTTIFAITILTSLNREDVAAIYGTSSSIAVNGLTQEAFKAGVHGIVCSAAEAPQVKLWVSSHCDIIVPGTRSPGIDANDQVRVDTPANAITNGATKLVIGRQVTAARDPAQALDQLLNELNGSA